MAHRRQAPFLRSVAIDWSSVGDRERYPFALPFVRELDTLELHPAVTYVVGENGSGKSTLLEAIAVALGFNAEGGSRNFGHRTRDSHSELHRHLELRRGRTPRDGFFLRAESWFNLATAIERMDAVEEEEQITFSGPPPPKVIASYGGTSLHEQSHGESFFALFLHRFGGQGFYLLDEPEAALSPTRQMALLVRIDELVRQGSQLVIATHSPIVLAYPDARIWQLSEAGIEAVDYERSDPFVVTKRFVADPEGMLRTLLRGGPAGEA